MTTQDDKWLDLILDEMVVIGSGQPYDATKQAITNHINRLVKEARLKEIEQSGDFACETEATIEQWLHYHWDRIKELKNDI